MKKRGIIVIDAILIILMFIMLIANINISRGNDNLLKSEFSSENFDVVVVPEYQKVLAGSTVKININVEHIKMGEIRSK